MPTRKEWNESPMRQGDILCPHCGYKWNPMDFVDGLCWNCWFIEYRPAECQRYWARADARAKAVESGSEPAPTLAPLQGAAPKRFGP